MNDSDELDSLSDYVADRVKPLTLNRPDMTLIFQDSSQEWIKEISIYSHFLRKRLIQSSSGRGAD